MDNFDPQKVYTDAIELYQNKKYRESIKHAHSGKLVNSEEKYILTGWMHFPSN